jgi:hypothetical protein
MIYTFLGIGVGVSLLLGIFIDVIFKVKFYKKEERKKKGLLVINGKRIL